MCFVPQRRALFQHLKFQKCSETEVFCTFWVPNVLRTTTACTFWTAELPKVLRTWGTSTASTSSTSSFCTIYTSSVLQEVLLRSSYTGVVTQELTSRWLTCIWTPAKLLPEHSFGQLLLVVLEYDLKWRSFPEFRLILLVCLVLLCSGHTITTIEVLKMIEHGLHPGCFRNWGPACRVLVENVSEWFSVFFLVYRPRSLAVKAGRKMRICDNVTPRKLPNAFVVNLWFGIDVC